MALSLKEKKAFGKGKKNLPEKKGPPEKKLKGHRPEEEDDEDLEDETDEDESKQPDGDDEDAGDEDPEEEDDEEPEEDGSEDAFDVSKLAADAEQIESIIDDIDGDLEGEDLDPKVAAAVKGSLGRLPRGARKLIREIKDKDFEEVEELVSQVAEDGSIGDEGRFAAWLYAAAQVA